MAIEYIHAAPSGDIVVKWVDAGITNEIHVENSIADLLVQDLIDAIRAAEASTVGQGYGQIARASGKEILGTGVGVGITVELLGTWRVYSTKSSGVFTVLGGNLVKSDGTSPFRPNNLITYVNILSAASTIVTTGGGGGGGGLTAGQEATLNRIDDNVAELLEDLQAVAADAALAAGNSGGADTTAAEVHTLLTEVRAKLNDDMARALKLIRMALSDQQGHHDQVRRDLKKDKKDKE